MMKKITKKYVYIFVGLIFLVLGIVFLSWFYEDIFYFFKSGAQLGRVLGTALVIYLGIFYSYMGIKNRMNFLSDVSLIMVFSTLILSFVLMDVLGCYNIGGSCPAYTVFTRPAGNIILYFGAIISFGTSIVSLARKKR